MMKIVAEQQMVKAIESAVTFLKSFKMTVGIEQAAQLIKNHFDGKENLLACFTEEEIKANAQAVLARI